MSILSRHLSSFRNGDPNGMYQAVRALDEYLDTVSNQLGGLAPGFVDNPSTSGQAIDSPPASGFNVVGLDGKFMVQIVNPQDIDPQSAFVMSQRIVQGINPYGTQLFHNLQSATTLNFDQASNVTDYGVMSESSLTVQDPNQTKFWRLRSSYDGQTWNDWQVFQSPVTCGPVGVWSGLLRTPALVMVNSAANTVDGSNALTQHGLTTQIDVAAKLWNVGTQKISYLGGSVDPGSFGTWYVYAIDITKAGGQVTFLATLNTGDLTAQDGIIIFGSIKTVGGGGGGGGGGGSCYVAGTLIEMYDGRMVPVESIRRGDELRGTDDQKEIAQADAEPVPNVPCFAMEFDNEVKVRGVSSSEPIELENGLFRNVIDLRRGMRCRTRRGVAGLLDKALLGNRLVWKLRLSHGLTYWADELGSHNFKAAN